MSETPIQPLKSRDAVELTYTPAPRRSYRKRLGSRLRSWARSTFSRESFISSLKSFAWVAPLTVLIWIYAEREHVTTAPNVGFNVAVPVNEAGRVVRLVSPIGGSIHAALTGPQAELDQVKDWLESTSVMIEIDRNLSPGEHEIPVAAELNRLPRLVSHGITATDCMPANIKVSIDPIREIALEVRVRPEDASKLNAAVFTPSKVKIIGPESLLNRAMRDGDGTGRPLVAYANLGQYKQQLSEAGKHEISSVALAPSIEISNATIFPTTVSAVVDVSSPETSVTLHGVRVLAASPDVENADRFKPVFDSTIPTLTVSGPESEIQALKEGRTGATAIFEVHYPTDAGGPLESPVIYQLPPHCHVSAEDQQRTIKYTLQPRKLGDQ